MKALARVRKGSSRRRQCVYVRTIACTGKGLCLGVALVLRARAALSVSHLQKDALTYRTHRRPGAYQGCLYLGLRRDAHMFVDDDLLYRSFRNKQSSV